MLVILDRNMDLCTPLHHTWTYQALVHDVLVSSVVMQPKSHDLMPFVYYCVAELLDDSAIPFQQ